MTVNRKIIGEVERYNGYEVAALFVGPDLICTVDGGEIANFYTSREAAISAGKKFCDELDKERGNE